MLLLLALACLPEPKLEDPALRQSRREAIRTSLKSELGEAYDQPVPGLAEADPREGESIYQKSCIACHGGALDGRGGRAGGLLPEPSALVGPEAGFYSDAAQVHLIENGVPGTAMAAWGPRFGHEPVLDVYAWLLEQRKAR